MQGKLRPNNHSTLPVLSFVHAALLHFIIIGSAFRPPPHFVSRPAPSPLIGTTTQFRYATKQNLNVDRGNQPPRPKSKINSLSNSYTQFYKEGVLVGIERTSSSSRRISGEILVNTPRDDIWDILTDYDRLSEHVPNLMESTWLNDGRKIAGQRPRVYQRGAQRVFGFEFGADVTLEMTERVPRSRSEGYPNIHAVEFKCIDSLFFSQFDGAWMLEESAHNKTMVRYFVDVRPKGPVPVAALEWRIKEDVPVNILAVCKAAQSRSTAREEAGHELVLARQQWKPTPRNECGPSDRVRSPPHPSTPNPRLLWNDPSAQILKYTAKAFLPAAVISTARQVMNAFGDANMIYRKDLGASHTQNPVKEWDRHEDMVMDWYEDETMATYL